MVRTDLPILLYHEDETTGVETYVVAEFDDLLYSYDGVKRRIVSVLNEKNILSQWAEYWDEYFQHWGKAYGGEFIDHMELMNAAWETDGFGYI